MPQLIYALEYAHMYVCIQNLVCIAWVCSLFNRVLSLEAVGAAVAAAATVDQAQRNVNKQFTLRRQQVHNRARLTRC